MNSGASNGQPKKSVVGGVGEIVSDVASLAELQFELLQVDAKESTRRLVVPAITTICGLLLLAGCFPVALISLAVLLYEFAGFSASAAFGISILAGLLLAIILVAAGYFGLRVAFASFDRSIMEFKRNIKWLKGLSGRDASSPTSTGHRMPKAVR